MKKEIDIKNWIRREQSEFFKGDDEPRFSITSTLDVTNLYRYVKENRLSFYYSLIYLSMISINSIDEFHYKLEGNKVFYYDSLQPSFCDLRKGETNYFIVDVRMDLNETIKTFDTKCTEKSFNQKTFLDEGEFEQNELVYVSCLPWIDVTSIVEERKFDKNDSIPHVCWGKYVEKNGRLILHYSIMVNHRLMDGYHVGLFFNRLQESIKKLQ